MPITTIYVVDPLIVFIAWLVGVMTCYLLCVIVTVGNNKKGHKRNDIQGKRKRNRSKRR